jgi:hypothetical protein
MPNLGPPAAGGIDIGQPAQLDHAHTAGVLSDDESSTLNARLPGM